MLSASINKTFPSFQTVLAVTYLQYHFLPLKKKEEQKSFIYLFLLHIDDHTDIAHVVKFNIPGLTVLNPVA